MGGACFAFMLSLLSLRLCYLLNHTVCLSVCLPVPAFGAWCAGAGVGVEPHQFQYPGDSNAQVVVYATGKNAAAGLAKAVTEAAAAAIKEKGSFTLVLSGEQHAAAVAMAVAAACKQLGLYVCADGGGVCVYAVRYAHDLPHQLDAFRGVACPSVLACNLYRHLHALYNMQT
jgi:hypothetical protein